MSVNWCWYVLLGLYPVFATAAFKPDSVLLTRLLKYFYALAVIPAMVTAESCSTVLVLQPLPAVQVW